MKIELVGFSQGVSLLKKDEVLNYLDFQIAGGRLFRLPISNEALQLLMAEVFGNQEPSQPATVPAAAPAVEDFGMDGEDIPVPMDGTVFGDDEGNDAIALPEESMGEVPESEEAVPSL